MKKFMKRFWIVIFVSLLFLGFTDTRVKGYFNEYFAADTALLVPAVHYGQEAQVVVQFLEMYHYRKLKFDDSVSSQVLDEYISALDNNRSYFTQADIDAFEEYRYLLDDFTKTGNLMPAYKIFEVFKDRFTNRMDFVIDSLAGYNFDFTTQEEYQIDRTEAPWATDEKALDEIWFKSIKNQALSLKLNKKESEEIEDLLQKRYQRFLKSMEQYKSEDIFQVYMNSITETYDPHSSYFSPKMSKTFQESISLSLEGIGARLQTDTDYTKVVQVIPGGPADKGGELQENDRIIGVAQGENEEMVDVIGWRIDDVVELIKGPKGTTVRLQVLPAETGIHGPPIELIMVREKIKIEDQAASKKIVPVEDGGKVYQLGVITLPSFYMDFEAYQSGDPEYNSTTRDVKRLIEELKAEGIDGLVVDLRNNGGGSLPEAIELTGLFIEEGPVVQVKDHRNKIEVLKDESIEVVYDGPLQVLINRFSASASEIFAGAIQDYKRGLVIGEPTFGKGTVQSIIDLSRYMRMPDVEAGQLKLTLNMFYRISGSSTQRVGVEPDIFLPSPFSAEEYGESARTTALPWEKIKKAPYRVDNRISPQLIERLSKLYAYRLEHDPELINFSLEVEDLKKVLSNTVVSLNEATRRKEMEAAEQRKITRDKSAKVTGSDEEAQITKSIEKIEDQYLRESLSIFRDMLRDVG